SRGDFVPSRRDVKNTGMVGWGFERIEGILESKGIIGHAVADLSEVGLHVKPRRERTVKLVVVRRNARRVAPGRPPRGRAAGRGRSAHNTACRTIADRTHTHHF